MEKSPRPNSQARIKKTKLEFLEHLKQTPIIQLVCDKMRISRSTVYRWMKEDPEFDDDVENAIEEGDKFFDDLVESKLMSLVNDKYWPAINSYITRKHPKYRNKKNNYDDSGKLSLLDLAKEVAEEEEKEEKRRKKKKGK